MRGTQLEEVHAELYPWEGSHAGVWVPRSMFFDKTVTGAPAEDDSKVLGRPTKYIKAVLLKPSVLDPILLKSNANFSIGFNSLSIYSVLLVFKMEYASRTRSAGCQLNLCHETLILKLVCFMTNNPQLLGPFQYKETGNSSMQETKHLLFSCLHVGKEDVLEAIVLPYMQRDKPLMRDWDKSDLLIRSAVHTARAAAS
ncbi:hypothetical protein WISP_52669 [Willisornis vidua]|uniref:Uncharacterized protein n=1 Tax=Willisornis vidua TaxID=1566151 RepID=A0ABQ9DG59_9PASS|nr:hypothetical protein WISP_52669 [Willisornis vidua]